MNEYLFGKRSTKDTHDAWMEAQVLDFIAAMSSTEVTSWNAQAGALDDVSLAIRNKCVDRKTLEKAFSERPAVP